MAEFDAIAPERDHASDGSVGDAAHQAETSSHNPDETGSVPIHDADHVNEIHAIDVDNNLRAAFTMEDCVQFLVGECRKTGTSGQDHGRLRNIIYNRRIWSASNGWAEKKYTGASPHTEHAHFDVEYISSMEADTRTWGLIERFGDDMLTAQEIAKAVWDYEFTRPDGPNAAGKTKTSAGAYQAYSDVQANNAADRVIAAVKAVAAGDDVDEAAIVRGVLAGLAPAALTDAVVSALAALPAETAQATVNQIRERLGATQNG